MPSTPLFRGGLHAAPRHELEELGWSRASPSASALLIQEAGGCVMWDCTPLVTPEVVQRIKTLGGLKAIAISHPHYYGAMEEWSEPSTAHRSTFTRTIAMDHAQVLPSCEGCARALHVERVGKGLAMHEFDGAVLGPRTVLAERDDARSYGWTSAIRGGSKDASCGVPSHHDIRRKDFHLRQLAMVQRADVSSMAKVLHHLRTRPDRKRRLDVGMSMNVTPFTVHLPEATLATRESV